MRILFLLTQDVESPSGLGRYLPLGRELVRLGHQINMIGLHPAFESLPRTRFEIDGVDIWYVAPMHVKKEGNKKSYYSAPALVLLAARAAVQLSRAAMSIPADIVHVCKPHPMNTVAGLLARHLGRKRLYLDCDDYETGSGRFNANWQKKGVEFFEKWIPRHTEIVTCNTHFMIGKLRAWGVPAERLKYLPNGVDRQRFIAPDLSEVDALRTKIGLTDKKVIAYVGSLSLPSHPVNLLLDAFSQVKQAQPESVLLLVGGGEDYVYLKQYAHKLGIEESARFCGRVSPSQVPLYYRLADVSVDPIYDNDAARGRSPLKLFESWASGVPFITADVGDRRMLIGSPPAGLVVQPGNPAELADGIIKIISSHELQEILRAQGLQRVEGFYWHRLATRLASTYDGAMQKI